MKKLLTMLMAFFLAAVLTTCAQAPKEPEPDYLTMMMQAAREGNVEAGREAEQLYRMQLQTRGEEGAAISFDDLYLLSRLIDYRYGNYRYSDELRMCSGEVILNRMASPEYPDSMEAVIFQEGQEAIPDPELFRDVICPSHRSVHAACKLLQGERMMEPSVILETHYPANDPYAVFCDGLLGNTYFYRSENLDLYAMEKEK